MTLSSADLPQSLVDAWNSHDPDRILALFTDDPIYEDVAMGVANRGREAILRFLRAGAAGMDTRFALMQAVTGPDRAAFEWTMTGTSTRAEPGGAATRTFTVRGASVLDIVGGRISHIRDYWDHGTLTRQLRVQTEPSATPGA
jgi:steroid delta-isomerase-like uncharacterized protein